MSDAEKYEFYNCLGSKFCAKNLDTSKPIKIKNSQLSVNSDFFQDNQENKTETEDDSNDKHVTFEIVEAEDSDERTIQITAMKQSPNNAKKLGKSKPKKSEAGKYHPYSVLSQQDPCHIVDANNKTLVVLRQQKVMKLVFTVLDSVPDPIPDQVTSRVFHESKFSLQKIGFTMVDGDASGSMLGCNAETEADIYPPSDAVIICHAYSSNVLIYDYS